MFAHSTAFDSDFNAVETVNTAELRRCQCRSLVGILSTNARRYDTKCIGKNGA
jgi:hypothetical protein